MEEILNQIKSRLFVEIGKLDNGSHSSNQLQGVDENLFDFIKEKLTVFEESVKKETRNEVLRQLENDKHDAEENDKINIF